MDEAQPGEPRPDRPEQPEDPADLEEEASSEDRQAREIPVDQRALNIVGIAQARDYLRAGRAATMKLGRPCPSCGAVVAHVAPAGPDLTVICATCGYVTRDASREELGLAELEPEPDPDSDPERDERRRSRQRHPATQSRLRRQN